MKFDDIKDKLPPNFVNKPNTVILIDKDGNPWYHLNEDGTSSGFDYDILTDKVIENHNFWSNKKP